MAHGKTLQLREQVAQDASRITILAQGPTATELPGQVVNRKNRLKMEALLERPKRKDLARARKLRKWTKTEQPVPAWHKDAEKIGVSDIAAMMAQTQPTEETA